MNFIEIADIIFNKKSKYNTISDKDKEDNFYIINKKLSIGSFNDKKLIKISQFFNHRYINKSGALDLWFLFFRNQYKTPVFWWIKNTNTKEKKSSKISATDRELLLKHNDINERDLDFIIEHYKDDVDEEIKKIKRFKGE